MAIAVGFGLAALFLLLLNFGERYVVGLVVVALAVAGVEFYDTVRSKGYQPAQFIGLAAIIGLPLAAYWVGVGRAAARHRARVRRHRACGAWLPAASTAARCPTRPSPCSASSTSACSAPTGR